MDRSASTSNPHRPWSDEHDSLPHWRSGSIPYNPSRSPPIPYADRQTPPPSHWPPRESFGHERVKSHSVPHDQQRPQWASTQPIKAHSPKMHSGSPTYTNVSGSPTYINASGSPTFVKGPPSPPDSNHGTPRSFSSPYPSPTNNTHKTITAMPGTMSARERERERSRSRNRSTADQHQVNEDAVKAPTQEAQPSASLSKRVKKGFKDLFKRTPVDESSLERIEDRHWAD